MAAPWTAPGSRRCKNRAWRGQRGARVKISSVPCLQQVSKGVLSEWMLNRFALGFCTSCHCVFTMILHGWELKTYCFHFTDGKTEVQMKLHAGARMRVVESGISGFRS